MSLQNGQNEQRRQVGTKGEQSWSTRYELRLGVRARYASVWDLPLLKRPQDALVPFLDRIGSLLDVGAYDRGLQEWLRTRAPRLRYRSLDVDRSMPHDFHSFCEVKDSFDAVVLFEVIEHMELSEAKELLASAREVMNPGALVFLSTPNAHHPNRFWMDVTHKVAYSYEELGATVMGAGFQLQGLYRVYHAGIGPRFLEWTLGQWLHRALGTDFATGLVGVGSWPPRRISWATKMGS